MTFRYAHHRRLEPREPAGSLARGFLAEVADPLWFLGRQWQLGEHQGEDASSPLQVRYRANVVPLEAPGGDVAYDPQTTPPEAVIESERGDWWTPGRRVRIGLAVAPRLPSLDAADPDLLLAGLPAPWQRLDGRGYDGRAVYERRSDLGLDGDPSFAEVPPDPVDLWDPAQLAYSATLVCGGRHLTVSRHDGGHLDWWSVGADGPLPEPQPPPGPVEVLAARLRYPGAPNPRWWEIEDARVDLGGDAPDRSHFPTMLLVDLVVAHSDDWFVVPIPAHAGTVVTVHEAVVIDDFGDEWPLGPPAGGWGLFGVDGLDARSLVLWPSVGTVLSGEPLDDVILGVDEDANLLLAVERRLAGRDVPTPARPAGVQGGGTEGQVDASARRRYAYLPSSRIPPRWHPYVIRGEGGRRVFVQGRFADLTSDPLRLAPEPRSPLLADPGADTGAGDPAHGIEPSTVPTLGLRLERRWMLARRTDGTPVLWVQRRRLPLLAPPVLDLRFDVGEERPVVRAP